MIDQLRHLASNIRKRNGDLSEAAICEQAAKELELRKIERVLGPDHATCHHEHYRPDKHGRRCTCGTLMYDPGD